MIKYSLTLLVTVVLHIQALITIPVAAIGPEPPFISLTCGPENGLAPLAVSCSAIIDGTHLKMPGYYKWRFSDGTNLDSVWVDMAEIVNISVDHEFTCPGTYTVTLSAANPGGTRTETIDVVADEPAFSITPIYTPGTVVPTSVVLQTTDDVRISRIARSIVDWGDGTPPEEFAWRSDGSVYATPSHLFSSPGDFTVTVASYYEGGLCSFEQSSSAVVRTNMTVPTKPSTWGRIKTLYN